jgi:hypothetical protein
MHTESCRERKGRYNLEHIGVDGSLSFEFLTAMNMKIKDFLDLTP